MLFFRYPHSDTLNESHSRTILVLWITSDVSNQKWYRRQTLISLSTKTAFTLDDDSSLTMVIEFQRSLLKSNEVNWDPIEFIDFQIKNFNWVHSLGPFEWLSYAERNVRQLRWYPVMWRPPTDLHVSIIDGIKSFFVKNFWKLSKTFDHRAWIVSSGHMFTYVSIASIASIASCSPSALIRLNFVQCWS